MSGWPAVLLFAAIAGVAGLVGVWLMWRHETVARRWTGELVTFASGLLVAGSLLHLMRRADQMVGGGPTMAWALAAFIVIYVAENHFFPHPHARTGEGETDAEPPSAHGLPRRDPADGSAPDLARGSAPDLARAAPFGLAAVFGLGIHSVLDGVAVGAGFSASFLTGSIIVSLVVAHKLPVGIASMGVLYHGGLDKRAAARYSSVVALLTPFAVVISYAALRDASTALIGALVAAAGGTFLYVGAADLLPEGQASGRGRNTLVFLLGVAVMVAALALAPHEAAP